MQTTFLRSTRSNVQVRKSVAELCRTLDAKLDDAVISALLERKPDEFDIKVCAQGIKALSKGSTRSKAVAFNENFRNKEYWVMLVERLSRRIFDVASSERSRDIAVSEFVTICTSLSRLRLGTLSEVAQLPRDRNSTLHLLRFAAEINADPNEVDIQELDAIWAPKRRYPTWFPGHLATSLAMLFKNEHEKLLKSPLKEANEELWKRVEKLSTELSQRDFEDLQESSQVLVPDGPGSISISKQLLEKLALSAANHSRSSFNPRPSLFQEEVYNLLPRLRTKTSQVTKETSEGVDLCVMVHDHRKGVPQKIGLQCYGPTHYVWDGSRLEGRTAFREYLLKKDRKLSYAKIAGIDYSEWERMGIEAKLRLLELLISV